MLIANPLHKDKRLISTATSTNWLTDNQILELIEKNVKFVDETEYQKFDNKEALNFNNYDYNLQEKLYDSPSGKESSYWLLREIQNIVKSVNKNVKVEVIPFNHTGWDQISIIVRLSPTSAPHFNGIVIIGSHQDSINGWDPMNGRAPGADDDGSGTAAAFEALRLIVLSEYVPKRTLEFHFYSAEEGGLLGSQAIALNYKQRNIHVLGVLQTDLAGYVKPNTTSVIGIETNYNFVDFKLTKLLTFIVDKYCSSPRVDTSCGYGCSDHLSWKKLGYPTAYFFEGNFGDQTPYMHSEKDSLDRINFAHLTEFVKAIFGWCLELTS
ncbi:Leucine aminopeptidase 1 [Clydaea vesicula]|uniref:Peptide hydrolase n=1 Tax=Clydaea vesicula TaxID=447962 RepID=A0AAD5TWM7_9FUNG|nr:Leucine aminopeptidase 1 [Clydaea vesicula]